MDSPNPLPPHYSPPRMPPGMSMGDADEFNKANWALGLGIASLTCSCLSAVPALIVGWPVMKRGHNPDARSRAKIGVIFSLVMLGIHTAFLILYVLWFVFAVSVFAGIATKTVPHLQALEKEVQQLDKEIREPVEEHFDTDET
ncbi:MAG: hypothetical protein FWG75_09140 [Cystobacterineae bacterium]|nr:hypothetical protein [Cystobacterineae bacterium]